MSLSCITVVLATAYSLPAFHEAANRTVERMLAERPPRSAREVAEYLPMTGPYSAAHFPVIAELLRSDDYDDRSLAFDVSWACLRYVRDPLVAELAPGRLDERGQLVILSIMDSQYIIYTMEYGDLLTRLGGPEYDLKLRRKALYRLASFGTFSAYSRLRAAGSDPSLGAEERAVAVAALIDMPGANFFPWLCELLESADQPVREAAETVLSAKLGEVSIPYLLKQFADHPRRRVQLMECLGRAWGRSPHPEVRPVALGSLLSPDPALRRAAVLATRRATGATQENWIILNLMQLDPSRTVQRRAFNELAREKWHTPWHWAWTDARARLARWAGDPDD